MTTTATSDETRVGAQRPRLSHTLPQVANRAREVIALGLMFKVAMDSCQKWTLRHITGLRADGKWSAFENHIEMPRQNGKTGQIEVLMIWHLFFVPESKKIVFSAHEFKTTREIYRRIENLISEVPAMYAMVKFNRGNDNLSMELKDGNKTVAIIQFLARSKRAGRGFSGDIIIIDEAFAMTAQMMAAIMPTMSARTITGNPQIIYLASAGMIDSHFLNGLRERCLGEDPGRIFFAEWSVEEGIDHTDREALIEGLYQANPALGKRISVEYCLDEMRSFIADPTKGLEEWLRERLGIRERLGGESLFDLDAWDALADATIQPSDLMAFAVDVPPSRDSASITMVSLLANGDVYMELIDRREGTSWVAERIKQLKARYDPVAVIVDDYSAAGSLLSPPNAAGIKTLGRVKTTQISIKEYAQACGELFDMVHRDVDDEGPTLVHIGQQELHDAVAVAKKTMRGETAWTLSRKDVLVDISPLVAGVHALIGLKQKATKRQRSQERQGIVSFG